MTKPKLDLKRMILTRIADGDAGSVWTPADFLDLGTRDGVDKVLQRLIKNRQLRRIDRGLYDAPRHNSLTQQNSPPDPRQVIEAVSRRDQIRVLVDGMTAANDLGLSNAVPAKIIAHTDARLKPIQLGNLQITFKPTSASKLHWAGRPAMRLVQALHWLRDATDDDDDDPSLRDKVRAILNDPAKGAQLRGDLIDGLTTLPAWMQDMLKPLLKDGTKA